MLSSGWQNEGFESSGAFSGSNQSGFAHQIDPPVKMKPASAYDYSQDEISGKFTDDWNYILHGNKGNPFSRYGEIFSRDWGMASTEDKVGLALSAIPISRSLSVSKSVWNHIFRNAAGHVNPATLSSQIQYYKLFQGVSSNPANLVQTVNASARMAGVQTFNQTFRGGKTVWVQTINGKIINAGVNLP